MMSFKVVNKFQKRFEIGLFWLIHNMDSRSLKNFAKEEYTSWPSREPLRTNLGGISCASARNDPKRASHTNGAYYSEQKEIHSRL